jgi:uncharacterized Zn finger protein (UPF0148 family)
MATNVCTRCEGRQLYNDWGPIPCPKCEPISSLNVDDDDADRYDVENEDRRAEGKAIDDEMRSE